MRSQQDGFTLSEVLLALGFLAGILVVVASLFISTARTSDKSGRMAPALLAGRELLDKTRSELRLSADASETERFWSVEHLSTPFREETVKVGGEDYLCRLFASTVTSPGGSPVGGHSGNLLKRVRVEISWRDGQQQGYGELKEQFVTLVAQ